MKTVPSGSGKSICLGHNKTGTSPPYFLSIHSDTHHNVCSQSLGAAGGMGVPDCSLQKRKWHGANHQRKKREEEGLSSFEMNGRDI